MNKPREVRQPSRIGPADPPQHRSRIAMPRGHHEPTTKPNEAALTGHPWLTSGPADQDRAQSERRHLSAIIDGLPDAVIIHSLSGDVLAWNRAAERMYGYASQEAVGKTAEACIPPEAQQVWEALRIRMKSGANVEPFQTRRQTKDGRTIDVCVSATALLDAAGRPEAFATTERDVTAMIEAQEATRIQQAEITRLERVHAMGEYAAAMAHELNQPLCAIGANAHAVKRMFDCGKDDNELREALADIVQDVDRARSIVQGMKDQLRKGDPDFQSLNLNDVVAGTAAIAEALARSTDARIRFVCGDGLRPVRGDRTQLQQVLLNLIRNGLEAMANTPPERRAIEVQTNEDAAGCAAVSVRDNGHGLCSAAAEQMFEPFFTTKEDGLGMGLPICASIIAAHRGRLWATNNSDAGCTLHVTLPYTSEDIE